jgi:putative two-component system response regulator
LKTIRADVLLVKKALQEKGITFDLSCFENGDKALKALSRRDSKAPDFDLLDLNLPTIEGIAVLTQIRNMPKLLGVPVVILTSSKSSSDMRRTETLGAARYIRKPLMGYWTPHLFVNSNWGLNPTIKVGGRAHARS